MEELAEGFGQLSTSAKEWKPPSETSIGTPNSPNPSWQQQQQHQAEDAWNSPTTPTNSSPNWEPRKTWNGPQHQQLQQPLPNDHSYHHQESSVSNSWRNIDQPYHNMSNESNNDEIPATIPRAPPTILSSYNYYWQHYRDVAFAEEENLLSVSDPFHKAIPPGFVALRLLNQHRLYGYPTQTFHVVCQTTGQHYCLRRVDNVRLSPRVAAAVAEKWTSTSKPLNPSGLVQLIRSWGGPRKVVFFLHEYKRGVMSLKERFLASHNEQQTMLPPEPLIWSGLISLMATIRAVHQSNLACRSISCSKVLVQPMMMTGGDTMRWYLDGAGILDVLEFEARKPLEKLQLEDWHAFGRVLLSLTTGTESTSSNIQQCLQYCRRYYSIDLVDMINQLLSCSAASEIQDPPTFYLWQQLEHQQQNLVEPLDSALSVEYDSSRALRLLLKLGFINERPELGRNRQWTESGDCYVLKLFRDYVFHQADEDGHAVMDVGHVVSSLNKLDAASMEEIVLASRDGKTLMVVTFADVARALEKSYMDLCRHSSTTTARYGG